MVAEGRKAKKSEKFIERSRCIFSVVSDIDHKWRYKNNMDEIYPYPRGPC
jgi:hypothetical protein